MKERPGVDESEGGRQEALAVAERCAATLREQFGARRVVVFGSAAGDGPWHEGSDLDLAVEGLSSAELLAAERQLERLLPTWLEVDLVPLEQVYPEVRAHILGEKKMPEEGLLGLKVRLKEELVSVERVVAGLEAALKRSGETPDEFGLRALASYVEDFYSGCERICERVAITLNGGVARGEGWRRELLRQMGERGGSGRPVLFGGPLLLDLDEYRRFRHRRRHLYGYELEAERVRMLARGVGPLFSRVREALADFGRWCGTADSTARSAG